MDVNFSSDSTVVYINDDPGVTLTYFTAISNLEKVKTVDFSEIIEACDLKVGRY